MAKSRELEGVFAAHRLLVFVVASLAPVVSFGQVTASSRDAAKSESRKLQDMIASALKRHPEMNAARANLIEAQAHLDRVRLEVAQRIVDHDKERQTLELQLKNEEQKLGELGKLYQATPQAISSLEMRAQQSAVEALKLELSSLETRLPLILGDARGEVVFQVHSAEAREATGRMLAHAQKAYDSAKELYQSGLTKQAVVILWSRRILKSEDLLHGETAEAADRHLQRVSGILRSVKAQFGSGMAVAVDYAAAQFAVSDAERMLSARK